MRWDDFRTSSNIEDDREASASRGGGLGIPGGGGGLGIGMVIILGLVGWALGIDPSVLIGGAQILTGGGEATQQSGPAPEVDTGTPNDQTGQFVAAVLGSTEDVWTEIFAANGRTYHAFTHGTSAQRKRWFMNGFNSGNISDCNTLSDADHGWLHRYAPDQRRCDAAIY